MAELTEFRSFSFAFFVCHFFVCPMCVWPIDLRSEFRCTENIIFTSCSSCALLTSSPLWWHGEKCDLILFHPYTIITCFCSLPSSICPLLSAYAVDSFYAYVSRAMWNSKNICLTYVEWQKNVIVVVLVFAIACDMQTEKRFNLLFFI